MGELKQQIFNLAKHLNDLIIEENYELQAFQVLECSKELDKLMVKYQKQLLHNM